MKLYKRNKQNPRPLTPAPVSRDMPSSPFWPMQRLRHEIDRLFEEPLGSWLSRVPFYDKWLPPVDVSEDKNTVTVKAEIPGMKKEEFEVYLSGDNLNIAGERRDETEEKGPGTYRSERYFGRFHRAIPLPAPVDPGRIAAHYKDGILTITCPKTAESVPKQVEVRVD